MYRIVSYPRGTMDKRVVFSLVLGVLSTARAFADNSISGRGIFMSVVNRSVNLIAPKDVCYGYLGCFSMSPPWRSPLRLLPTPSPPESIETNFYLYTSGSPGQRYTVKKTPGPEVSVEGSDYDGSKTTFFITHGFSNNGNMSWLSEMKDAILKKFDANVFLVDWGKGATLLNYPQVASNTRVVAAELERLAKHLITEKGSDPSRLHLIGHSLGAQISSYVAKRIPNVARLTALDPAQPAFEGYSKEVRLDKSDAEFVEVIHTSARPFIPFLGLGMVANYGHVDFYINGGWEQPGCIPPPTPNITSFRDLATVPVEVLSKAFSCSHGRSSEIFTDSLAGNCTFWGHQKSNIAKNLLSALTGGHLARLLFPSDDCTATTCAPLGIEAINYPARGEFYVATNSDRPYCVHEPLVDDIMKQYRKTNLNPADLH